MVILQRFANILLRINDIYNLRKIAGSLVFVYFCKHISSTIHFEKAITEITSILIYFTTQNRQKVELSIILIRLFIRKNTK